MAEQGYAVKIFYYETNFFPTQEGDEGDQKLFFVTVLEKMSFSLSEVQQWYPFLGNDGLQKIALQLMQGLQAIHQTGYIHSNIKPEHIMIKEVDKKFYLKFSMFNNCQKRISDTSAESEA